MVYREIILRLSRNVILFEQILELYVKKYVKQILNINDLEFIKIIYRIIYIFIYNM